jgi:hypothetical protein
METTGIKHDFYKTMVSVLKERQNDWACAKVGKRCEDVYGWEELNRSWGVGKAYSIDDVAEGLFNNLVKSAVGKSVNEIAGTISAIVFQNC